MSETCRSINLTNKNTDIYQFWTFSINNLKFDKFKFSSMISATVKIKPKISFWWIWRITTAENWITCLTAWRKQRLPELNQFENSINKSSNYRWIKLSLKRKSSLTLKFWGDELLTWWIEPSALFSSIKTVLELRFYSFFSLREKARILTVL